MTRLNNNVTKFCPYLSKAMDVYSVMGIDCRKEFCEFWYKKENRCSEVSTTDNTAKILILLQELINQREADYGDST